VEETDKKSGEKMFFKVAGEGWGAKKTQLSREEV